MDMLIANISGRARRATIGGREYLVAPATMLVPGVLSGSRGPLYYPPEEVARNIKAWDHVPLTVYHPTRNGTPVSAREPDILDKYAVGYVLRTRIAPTSKGAATTKLVAEAWFDVEAVKRIDLRVLNALESGAQMELSTGLYTDHEVAPAGSTYNGRTYTYIARNYRPDHLAILPDQIGACSIVDGCGLNVNAQKEWAAKEWREMVEKTVLTNNCRNAKTDNAWSGSLDDRRRELANQLEERFGSSVYLSDVYEDYVIYSKGYFGGSVPEYYRLGYLESDDGCILSDDKPVEVKRVTSYEPVGNATGTNIFNSGEGGRVMSLTVEERGQIVDQLTTNCDCWKGEGDRTLLESFSDDKLIALRDHALKEARILAVANTAAHGFQDQSGSAYRVNPETGKWEKSNQLTPKPTQNADKVQDKKSDASNVSRGVNSPEVTGNETPRRPRTTEDWLRTAPPELQNAIRVAQQVEHREKEKLINELLANVGDVDRTAHRERLMSRSVDDLQYDLDLRKKSMPAQTESTPAPQQTNNRVRRVKDKDDDVLQMPTMNWTEISALGGDEPIQKKSGVDNSGSSGEYMEINEEELIATLPPHLRSKYTSAIALAEQERRKLINELTANAADEETERRLMIRFQDRSLEELRDLVALLPKRDAPRPNYFGAAAAPIGNAKPSNNDTTEDVLPLPTMNWADMQKQA